MLTADEIRRRFLDYFKSQGHTIVASSPLVPREDPSLLFTNAGMVQFKKVFLGQEKRDYVRAATSQKCLRVGGKHNDLENVGKTARHHTFFEMLGNFSFGDYFKDEAIRMAWEFLTEDLGLDKSRMYATVFREDDEAEELWQKIAGLPKDRIHRLDEKDNFWSMGETGPCGPCSEILYDQGEEMSCGPECEIGVCDCDRYLEIWNLVFMQFNRDESGEMTSLPKPSIDTGMGLERIAAVCQGVNSNYDTDLFAGIISEVSDWAGVKYKTDEETDTALRVIADHSRAAAFLLADGVLPSNEGRGYILRRLIRRAFRFGRFIGLSDPFLFRACAVVVGEMGRVYPELVASQEFMSRVVLKEEEQFGQTLDKGLVILSEALDELTARGGKVVSGQTAFKLYDTFGFPLDIVRDVAEKQGFTVDEPGYNELMAEQKERAKKAWKGSGEAEPGAKFAALADMNLVVEFTGYDRFSDTGEILAVLDDNGRPVQGLSEGDTGYVVVSRTPFYAASGGQVADTGRIDTKYGRARVVDVVRAAPQIIVHRVKETGGRIEPGKNAVLLVDKDRRLAIMRNHTATHLLQAALRKVLGKHVKQSGSLVEPDRLRFDFTHIQAMTGEEIGRVEDEVNKAIMSDLPVECRIMEYDLAVSEGAMALFGEKYEDDVRVVEVKGVSKELCGGTHLSTTGQAGSFYITAETGIASGVRRIEAVTGWGAVRAFQNEREEMAAASAMLKAQPGEVAEKIRAMQDRIRALTKEKEQIQARMYSSRGRDIMDGLVEVGGVKVLAEKVEVTDVKALRDLMDDVRSKLPSGVACLASAGNGKAQLILYVSKDLHDKFTAPGLIKPVAEAVGGSGGGRPDLAQAGGDNPAGISDALARLKELLAGN